MGTNPPSPCTNTEAVNNYAADVWLGFKPLGEIVTQQPLGAAQP